MGWCAKLPAPVLGLGNSCSDVPVPDTHKCQLWEGRRKEICTLVCKASSSSSETQTWAGQRVFVNYVCVSITSSARQLLLSGKAGKSLGRPVRLPHSADGCLEPGGCLRGTRNPQSHTWAPAFTALRANWTCWGHTCSFTSDIQGGRKQEPRTRLQLFTPTLKKGREGFRISVGCFSMCVIQLPEREPSRDLKDA